MRKTETLGLPIYDAPESDLFKFQDWNEGNQKIDNKIKEFGSSLDLITSHYINKYFVGMNYPYKTINQALTKWISDGKPNSEILISKGEYNEVVVLPANINYLKIKGNSKEDTIIRTKTGMYKDAPMATSGGNIIFEGITFIADHSENSTFNYEGNPDKTGNALYQCAYALHCDGGNGGKIIVKDCDLISYQDSAFGSGTVNNGILRLENCNLFSYTDTVEDFPNAWLGLSHGALLYHTMTDNNNPTSFERLELVNVNCYTKNSPQAIAYKNYSSNGSKKELLTINVNGGGDRILSAENIISQTSTVNISGDKFNLDKNSGGNNCNIINAYTSEITKDIVDCNAINGNGRFIANTNTPTTSNYFIEQTVYGNYKYQLASKMTSGETYRRSCNNGVWGSWIVVDNPTTIDLGFSKLVTDCNAITSSGFYQTSTNCINAPNTSSFHVLSFMANISYGYQLAIKMTDNTIQFKRTLNNKVWTDWVAI